MSYKIYKRENHLGMLGKKHSVESNQKNREKHLGKKASKETKKKLSESLKLYYSKNKVWNKGISHTKEHIEKMKGHTPWNKGKEWDKNVKEKISKNHRKYQSQKTREKISLKLKEKYENCEMHINHKRGKEHHNWKGGSSLIEYGYEFNEPLRKKIRKRDNHICQLCFVKKEKGERNFDVHHIDYNKYNNAENNLITLCHSCHTKTNTRNNNIFYINLFTNLILKKYNE